MPLLAVSGSTRPDRNADATGSEVAASRFGPE